MHALRAHEHKGMFQPDRVSLGEFLGVNGWGRLRPVRGLAVDARVLRRLKCLEDEFVLFRFNEASCQSPPRRR
jgi:hypothetical protein